MPVKVYYLDDESDLLELFSEAFSSDQIEILTFSKPADLLEAAQKNPPDVVFLDFRLPGTTGDQIAKLLDPKIPKYLITGELKVLTDFNFVEILGKPYDEKKIVTIINSFFKAKS